jgi:hypothetical protein
MGDCAVEAANLIQYKLKLHPTSGVKGTSQQILAQNPGTCRARSVLRCMPIATNRIDFEWLF